MVNALRWLAVLPGSVLCAILSSFPLHFVLYQTLTGSGVVEPYPHTPERLLSPLVAAIAFVLGGTRIAPSRRFETAVVLFGACLLLIGVSLALAFSGAHFGSVQYRPQLGGLPQAGAVGGACIGLYIARRANSLNAESAIL